MKKSLLLLSSLFILTNVHLVNLESINAEENTAVYKDTDFTHSVEENIDVFETDKTISGSMKNYADNFFRKSTELLRENHEELKNGVIFVDKIGATDSYGNKKTINSIVVWLSQETIDKIQFENKDWGKSPEDIYNVADTVYMMSDTMTDKYEGKTGNPDAPDAYFMKTIEGY